MTISYKFTLGDSLVYSVAHYTSNVSIWDDVALVDWFETKFLRHSCGVSSRVSGDAVR